MCAREPISSFPFPHLSPLWAVRAFLKQRRRLIPETLEHLKVPIAELSPLAGNPRRGDVEFIKASLQNNTQYRPIVVNRRTMQVLAGNHTFLAAKELGWAEVAATFVDVDDEQAKAIALVDNHASDRAYNDPVLLAAMLREAKVREKAGYSQEFLEQLLVSIGESEEKEGLTDPDEVPETPAKPVSRRGDLWTLGEHRLLCGDATSRSDVEKLMAGELASVMWTDPPYGVSYVGKTKEALTITGDGRHEAIAVFADALPVADEVLLPGSPFYVAHPSGVLSVAFGAAVLEVGWRLHQILVWVKDSMVVGHSDYHYKHEPILYGYKPGEGRFGRGGKGWYGGHSETSVFELPKPRASADHPTMKPVRLVERHLLNSSRRGAFVYEPFCGSGSTLLAAHRTGRRCRALEIDPRYADVICRRFQEYTGEMPILEATGEPHDFRASAGTAA